MSCSEYYSISDCVDVEIHNFLNNFNSINKEVAPVMVFPTGLGVIFYKYLRYISSLYNLTAIYIGNEEFKTIAILRIEQLKNYYGSNSSWCFNYSNEDSEPLDPNHIQHYLNISLTSTTRKIARRFLKLPVSSAYQPSAEMQMAERYIGALEEEGKPRRSSGALYSVRRFANPTNTSTLFNYEESPRSSIEENYAVVQTPTEFTDNPVYSPEPINYGQMDQAMQPPPVNYIQKVERGHAMLVPPWNMQENIQNANFAEIEEASAEDISEELEALKIQNLGETYEKEYGQYMYDSNNPSTFDLSYYNRQDHNQDYPTANYSLNLPNQCTTNLEGCMSKLQIGNDNIDNKVEERIPDFPVDYTLEVDEIKCVPNKPMYDYRQIFSNLSGVLNLNQAYKQEIAEYIQGTPLIVLASENYDPYKKLDVFTMKHIVEIYDFPVSFFSNNLLNVHKEKPRYLKWCDDTHALLVMGSEDQALRALKIKNRFIKSRPLTEGSPIAITIACQYNLQPAKKTRSNRQTRLPPEYQSIECLGSEQVQNPIAQEMPYQGNMEINENNK